MSSEHEKAFIVRTQFLCCCFKFVLTLFSEIVGEEREDVSGERDTGIAVGNVGILKGFVIEREGEGLLEITAVAVAVAVEILCG